MKKNGRHGRLGGNRKVEEMKLSEQNKGKVFENVIPG